MSRLGNESPGSWARRARSWVLRIMASLGGLAVVVGCLWGAGFVAVSSSRKPDYWPYLYTGPGVLAGAGLIALILACLGYWIRSVYRRRA